MLFGCRGAVVASGCFAAVSTAVCSVSSVVLLLTFLLSGRVAATLREAFTHPVGKALLVFVLWLLISAFYAPTAWTVKLTALLSWQKLFFVFLVLGLFGEPLWKRRFIECFTWFMAALAVVSIVLWGLGVNYSGNGPGIILTNYIAQSLAFTAALLCCMHWLTQSCSRRRYWVVAAAAVFVFNIFIVSPARSGYIALPPAMLVAGMCFFGRRILPKFLLALALALGIAAMSSNTLRHRVELGLHELNSYQASENLTSVGLRMVLYTNSWELIQKRPWLGYGTSSFAKVFHEHVAEKYQDWRGVGTTDPHNQYLFVWFENGLAGLILFLGYIVVAFHAGLRRPPYGYLAMGLLASFCVSSLFSSHFKTYPEGNLLAFFLSAMLAGPPLTSRPYD